MLYSVALLGDTMRKSLTSLLVLLSLCSIAVADWDPVLEAQEAAQRAAADRAQAEQRRKAEELKQQALAKSRAITIADYRKQIGKDADGKSDAEVERLYLANVQKKMKEADVVIKDAQRAMLNAPKNIPQKVDMNELDVSTKAATGKSFADLSKMSDAELEALSKEMEQKYGE
jgi:hypothetical protein